MNSLSLHNKHKFFCATKFEQIEIPNVAKEISHARICIFITLGSVPVIFLLERPLCDRKLQN